jgi:hypothetical protein
MHKMQSIHLRTALTLSLLILAQCVSGGASFGAQRDCRTGRERSLPIPLGVSGSNLDSIGRRGCCSGTLGSLVQDSDGNQYILSNSHVLVTKDNSQAIIQPGLADLGCDQSRGQIVAEGITALPISTGPNFADAAIGEVVAGDVDATGRILNIGNIAAGDAVAPRLGMKVRKMGARSCVTAGRISALQVSIRVRYPRRVCDLAFSGVATFRNQIQIRGSSFSNSGDSGSLIVTTGSCPGAVGLLFAGSGNSTFASPMRTVLGALNVSMVGNSCTPTGRTMAEAKSGGNRASSANPESAEVAAAAATKNRYDEQLMQLPGVVGTAVGLSADGRLVIKIYVEKDTAEVRKSIPAKLDSIPLEVEETGPITAY